MNQLSCHLGHHIVGIPRPRVLNKSDWVQNHLSCHEVLLKNGIRSQYEYMTIPKSYIIGYFIVKPILNQQGFGSHYSTFNLSIVHKLPQKASGNETCILANSPCIDDFPIKTMKNTLHL